MRRLPLLASAVLLLGLRPVQAQRPTRDSLPAGARVRFTPPAGDRTVGQVLGFRGDSLLVLIAPADTVRLARSMVPDLEVSLGARPRVGQAGRMGALIGLVVGAGAGAVVSQAEDVSGYEGLVILVTSTAGLVAGAITGAVVGAVPVERWQRVGEHQRTTRLWIVRPTDRSGTGLRVAIRF